MLAAASFLPVTLGMAGVVYGLAVAALNAIFLSYAIRLLRNYSDALSRKTFGWSIVYLTGLFAALFADRLLT
jgi:protoheme IX farnesyltransferase